MTGAAHDAAHGPEGAPALTATNVSVTLDGAEIVRDVRLAVPGGGWLSVIGPNGAGKSTLLRAMAGLVPYGGSVRVGETSVRGMPPRERARLIAYAPQIPRMPADMPVFDYVLLGRTPYIPYFGGERRSDRRIATGVLERLDLDGLAGRRLGSLSGGERQRVVLARALAQEAAVLLLDEPTSALDLGHQQQVLELVEDLRAGDGLTVVTTLHDLNLAGQYADEVLLLSGGRAVAHGPAARVLTEPAIAAHYGADVRVTADEDGGVQVHLVRRREP